MVWKGLVAKVAQLCEEFIETKVRFEALDKEVYRMTESLKQDLEKQNNRQLSLEQRVHQELADLTRRVTQLEAEMSSVVKEAMFIVAKEARKEAAVVSGKRESLVLPDPPFDPTS